MPFTDKNGKVWPDTMDQSGVNLILDPAASVAAGRPKYRPDPNQRKQWGQQYGFVEKDPKQTGMGEALGMLAVAGATPVLANQLGESFTSAAAPATEASALTGDLLASQGVGIDAAANTAAWDAATSSYGNGVAPSFANSAADVAGPGAEQALGYSPYLGLAGAALGGYGLHKAIEKDDPLSGGLSGAALGSGLTAASPLLLGGGPVGWTALGIGALAGGLGGAGLTSLLAHESTREAAAKKTKNLLGASNDPAYQAYVQGMRKQYESAPTGPAYAGKYNTFDEYKQAGLQANDLTGVYGNIKAFGPEWATLSQADREKVTQGIINAGLYDSKKGDVVITDEEKAKAIRDSLLGRTPAALTPAQQQLAAVQTNKPVLWR
jgi:hypothetical protein